jgi:hypothetical protein
MKKRPYFVENFSENNRNFDSEATIHRADRFISHRISTENAHGIPIELVIYGIF